MRIGVMLHLWSLGFFAINNSAVGLVIRLSSTASCVRPSISNEHQSNPHYPHHHEEEAQHRRKQ
jgi:hypothetical protein